MMWDALKLCEVLRQGHGYHWYTTRGRARARARPLHAVQAQLLQPRAPDQLPLPQAHPAEETGAPHQRARAALLLCYDALICCYAMRLCYAAMVSAFCCPSMLRCVLSDCSMAPCSASLRGKRGGSHVREQEASRDASDGWRGAGPRGSVAVPFEMQ
eukprot:3932894-Rhodomonas_salina.1